MVIDNNKQSFFSDMEQPTVSRPIHHLSLKVWVSNLNMEYLKFQTLAWKFGFY
jgi:hypothetical protein